MATIYRGLGISQEQVFYTPDGRPIPIVPGDGKVIPGLF
jgi:hypothetical protein